MHVQLPARLDKPAFLAWVQGREGRYELARGRVIISAGGSRAHATITNNASAMLQRLLDGGRWTVAAEVGVDVAPETVRYPDIVVEQASGLRNAVSAAPVLIAEVLSPSTADIDLGDKAAEYLRLPGLAAYLVFAQSERKVWAWIGSDGRFSPGPAVIADDAAVEIAPLDVSLPLSQIYAGTFTV